MEWSQSLFEVAFELKLSQFIKPCFVFVVIHEKKAVSVFKTETP